MVPNAHRRCRLTLVPRVPELKGFSLIIYGRSAADLSVVPCEEISSIAARYPDYHSSLFFLTDLEEIYPERLPRRNRIQEKA